MKSAYLYVRVSTDEQRRKGYSLSEQESRLLAYCEQNNIQVKGIYREDYSAKNFKRPEWGNLLNTIKRVKTRPSENILFVKWDRFSRNIELAYQMLGILRTLNVQAMAIDQPIDFSIPESTVTLAVYLSIPDAENGRRSLNISGCIRRAKMAGRWTGKAPKGYANLTTFDGKKYIEPSQPDADLIKWSFRQLAKGTLAADTIRKMACERGLQCESSNFWKLIRNPVYCGIIVVPPSQDEEIQFIKALHKPLISKALFYEVQDILNGNQRQFGVNESVKYVFPLRGFLMCPLCNRKLTGSISKGRHNRYPYYHCIGRKCKARFKAELLNEAYENQLSKFKLTPQVHELFELIVANEKLYSNETNISERKLILRQISEQELLLSQARKFFLKGKIEADDFRKVKKEYSNISGALNIELCKIDTESFERDDSEIISERYITNLLYCYRNQDIADKRNIINFITPVDVNAENSTLNPPKLNEALSKIMITI